MSAADGLPEPVAWRYTTIAGMCVFHRAENLHAEQLENDKKAAIEYPDAHQVVALYTADQMRAAIAAEREKWRKVLAESCAEERSQMWEAGPGGGCSRAIEAEAELSRLRELIAEQLRTIQALMVGMPDDGTTPVIVGIARLEAERDALRAFARKCMAMWPDGGIDGFELQDAAIAHGLLVPEQRNAPCAADGACECDGNYSPGEWAEGITCYRRVEWLRDAKGGRRRMAEADQARPRGQRQ